MSNCEQLNAGAVLTIDLAAICANWRLLKSRLHPNAECAAVVKADAYGLGALHVAPALYRAGCRQFFVAHVNEGIALRPALPPEAQIYVLHGAPPGAEGECVRHGLVPVLNSLRQLVAWRTLAKRLERPLPAVLQFDTGMARLGLAPEELEALHASGAALEGIDLRFVMSHLVSAEDQDNPINEMQRERFAGALQRFPGVKASLANSSGIFLGADYHFDLVRPGAALYGVAPVAGASNPLRPVVRLQGRVIQVRWIDAGTAVGYGHTWRAPRPSRIATVAVGYADGYLRSLSNRGVAYFEGAKLRIVGNVSMDTITIDVTDMPAARMQEGACIDFADPVHGVDQIAQRAGTIGYEILTSLGHRYARAYQDATAAAALPSVAATDPAA